MSTRRRHRRAPERPAEGTQLSARSTKRLANRKMRAQTGEFLAEGPQAVREALAVPGVVLEVFATQKYDDWRVDGVLWHLLSEADLAAIADAVSPQGVVARCASVVQPLSTLSADPQLVAVGVGVSDPGNAGSLVRAADAAGADAVIFTGDSVDPLNPKAVRATVGSLFHLPVIVEPDVDTVLAALRQRGLRLLAADGDGEVALFQLELGGRTAWLFGNEAHGMSADLLHAVDERVAIPIFGRAESLNLATAAAVCLYASANAQRGVPPVIE